MQRLIRRYVILALLTCVPIFLSVQRFFLAADIRPPFFTHTNTNTAREGTTDSKNLKVSTHKSDTENSSDTVAFRVHVYNISEVEPYMKILRNSQFATEWLIPKHLLNSQHYTAIPEQADVFVVPIYPMGINYHFKSNKWLQNQYAENLIPEDLKSAWQSVSQSHKNCSEVLRGKRIRLTSGNWLTSSWCTRLFHQAAVLRKTIQVINKQGPWWKRRA
eukprot:7460629-Pyramimonas_sp.AAC.1